MRPSEIITEAGAVWNALPPFARYTIGGAGLGAVGYLARASGIGQLMASTAHQPYRHPSWHDWQGTDDWHGGGHHHGHHHSHRR